MYNEIFSGLYHAAEPLGFSNILLADSSIVESLIGMGQTQIRQF